MSLFTLRRGNAPLILSMPHAGTEIPKEFAGVFISDWLARKDADWHIPTLYAFAETLDATIIAANISRAIIDLNRDPSGASLYPGQATTGLCPVESFGGEPLYAAIPPDEAETARRVQHYFRPYHAALEDEITRLRARHDNIVLYDCHSIRSQIPRLFPDELPQFNIGTNGGASCAPNYQARVEVICARSGFSWVLNGRFKGGWITRHYGQPQNGVHAIQMELAMRGYMDEPAAPTPENWPTAFNPSAPILPVLQDILKGLCP
ncbi:N-formylglutamate deformylase [Acidocella aromatica]|uniref:Formiminoglutamase n=1 Tax=Acidocella aromatica TaxID=1303579 RepID=A0A840VPL3_9PROT|nr:N-formylglutamate deformylase [Acidocella aromatica]MBB5372232.1 formiminoglutamase [Acidocella aromatica]